MTKKAEADIKRLKRAVKIMHGDCPFGSTGWFIETCLDFLSSHLGDIHLEYLEHEGWSCSCCRAEGDWNNWCHGKTPQDALAKAVIYADKFLKGKR